MESDRSPRAVQAAGFAMRTVMETASRVRERGRARDAAELDRRLHHLGAGGPQRDRPDRRRRRHRDDLLLRHRELHHAQLRARRRGVGAAARGARPAAAHLRRQAPRPRREEPGRRLHGGVLHPRARRWAARWTSSARCSAKRQRSRQLRRTPIRVRIGLHTGTAIERDGDYFGRNVAMAARVAAMADGGEILVSSELADRLGRVPGLRPDRDRHRSSSRACRASTCCGWWRRHERASRPTARPPRRPPGWSSSRCTSPARG